MDGVGGIIDVVDEDGLQAIGGGTRGCSSFLEDDMVSQQMQRISSHQ